MDQFSRTVLGYHGCTEEFADKLLLGQVSVGEWEPSRNHWDWLGHGVYFWEHSPERALRWAREVFDSDKGEKSAVIGPVVQLGRCFDLLNESVTVILGENFQELKQLFEEQGKELPKNIGKDWKSRNRDCLTINETLSKLEIGGERYDTVRGTFTEGEPVYEGAGFSKEAHIQIAVRNPQSILGVFRPNLSQFCHYGIPAICSTGSGRQRSESGFGPQYRETNEERWQRLIRIGLIKILEDGAVEVCYERSDEESESQNTAE